MFFTKRVQKILAAAGSACALLACAPASVSAQDGDGSRQIKLSDPRPAPPDDGSRQIKISDFTSGRPRQQGAWVAPRREYKRVAQKAPRGQARVASAPRRTPPRASQPRTRVEPRYEEVGVTVWRLRRARPDEAGPRLQDVAGGEWWTPERVEGTTPLNVGDRVRLSVESPRAGYLYIISTDQYADDTTGTPRLIFPTTRTRGGDNRVAPGRLIDIPDQSDDTNYFTVSAGQSPTQARQVGEVLTVIVSRTPIPELSRVGRSALALKPEQVAAWERQWGGPVDLFELRDGAGLAWTKAEQEASSVGGRSLTQEEPTPQTIYSVETRANSPLLVRVQLFYGQQAAAKN